MVQCVIKRDIVYLKVIHYYLRNHCVLFRRGS